MDKIIKNVFDRLTEPPLGKVLAAINGLLSKNGIDAWLVGGVVRDAVLGRNTKDIDIAVSADALDVAEKAAKVLHGHYVVLDEKNRVGRVVFPDRELDFSTVESTLEHDLARRDFTINAMAVGLDALMNRRESVRIVDPFHGRKDIRDRAVRAVSESVFSSDPVRLIRAVRFAAELDFHIGVSTKAWIKRDVGLLGAVPGERAREEALKILAAADNGQSLVLLDKLGLLTVLFPELAVSKGVTQPKEHAWDVFQHSLKTAQAVDYILHRGEWPYFEKEALAAAPWNKDLAKHFDGEISHGSTRRSLLKLAGLLHDVAKPETKVVQESGRIRFLGHDKDGALTAAAMLTRLRFSVKEIDFVETVIEHHMRPTQMSQGKLPTPRAVYRFFRDIGTAGTDILFFSLADHLAARGPNLDIVHWREHAGMVEYVLNTRGEQTTKILPVKLIDGDELIKRFGLEPGPRIGKILEKIHEAQATGRIKTKSQALKMAKTFLKTRFKI